MITNDLIIVGGGISGLYTAYIALKKNPTMRVLLLEASGRLGGRISTHWVDEWGISVEAGAGRFHRGHKKLWKLIHELGLGDKIVSIGGGRSRGKDRTYIPVGVGARARAHDSGASDDGISKMLMAAKQRTSKEFSAKLKNMTFMAYATEVLGESGAKSILDSFGYSSELTDMNAYDSLVLMRQYDREFYFLRGGLEQIVDSLVARLSGFGGFSYRLREPVVDVNWNGGVDGGVDCGVDGGVDGGKFVVRSGSGRVFSARICVCALIRECLEKLPIFSPIRPLLRGIRNLPLCRIYTRLYDVSDSGKWWDGITRTTTNNRLRYIIPIRPDLGIFMISYTDNHYADWWKRIYDESGTRGVNQSLKKGIDALGGVDEGVVIKMKQTKVFYWKYGVAYFQPGFDSETMLPKIRRPFVGIPLYVCGENYSVGNSQWIEGALDTVPDI